MSAGLTVSIAMTTFNGERYLREQLASFLEQDALPDEVVICDDASTDGTRVLLEQFAASAPFPVRISVNPQRLGITRNFERALAMCTSRLLLISDQDDVWLPGKVRHVRRFFEDPGEAHTLLLATDAVMTDANLGTVASSLLREAEQMRGTRRDFVAGCCTAIRRELLALTMPFPVGSGAIGYDEWLHMAADFLGSRVVQDVSLQYYRRHASNSSQAVAYEPQRGMAAALQQRCKRIGAALEPTRKSNWLELQRSCASHVHARITEAPPAGAAVSAGQLQRLERVLRSLEERKVLRGRPRVVRLPSIARLYLQGGYEFFSGWKSMVSDAL